MGLRFRRSIRVLPGVRLNLSKSGLSTSIGVRGAHVTIGHGQVRETVGIPGTGLSYTESHSTHARAPDTVGEPSAAGDAQSSGQPSRGVWLLFWLALLASFLWFIARLH